MHHPIFFANLSFTHAQGFTPPPEAPGMTTGTFQELIDHSPNPTTTQKFNQRYWIDSEFASGASAPVLYHVCGEGACDEDYFLRDAAIEHAKALGAHLVYLEHRYYGKSQPFSDLSNAHLKYLTLSNVIEDLVTFQKWVTQTKLLTGKWIILGGSYSGTLAALYRLEHPELVVGALAASAPMKATALTTDDDDSNPPITSTDLTSNADVGDRQWAYESCTIFGFWLSTTDDPSGLVQPAPSLCLQVFGVSQTINDSTYNEANYNPFVVAGANSASQILFTNGSDDPWSALSIEQQSNQNPNIATQAIPGAGHHFDLNYPDPSDTQAVIEARALFETLAKTWLQD